MSVAVRRLDRVSIAVRDLEAARAFFERHFGAEFGAVEDVAVDGYRYVPFTLGGFTLELLAPSRPESPIARFLDRRGEGLYQLSLMVEDVDRAAGELREAGLTVLGPRTYPDDVVLEGCRWKEAFVHPRDAFGVLLFLGERVPVASQGPRKPRPRCSTPAAAQASDRPDPRPHGRGVPLPAAAVPPPPRGGLGGVFRDPSEVSQALPAGTAPSSRARSARTPSRKAGPKRRRSISR